MSQTGNYLGTENIQRLSAKQLAEMDRIKNDVFEIIKKNGLLIHFEAANDACDAIAKYIMKENTSFY